MTLYQAMCGEKKDVSDFRAFGFRAWVHEDKHRQGKGKHTPRAKEAMYVGFADNMSAWASYIPENRNFRKNQNVQSGQIF